MGTNGQHVRVIARLARIFESRLGEESLTLPQFRLLAFLAEGEWAASALADHLAVSRPSVTALVDGLVERGWVERRDSQIDRRRVLHQITAEGRAVHDRATDLLAAALDDLLGHLEPELRKPAIRGLDLLALGMKRHWEAVTSA